MKEDFRARKRNFTAKKESFPARKNHSRTIILLKTAVYH